MYSVHTVCEKSTSMYNMVRGMLNRSIPIDGIGLQFHISTTTNLSTMGANIARFAALGLEVHLTEMDIRCSSHCTPAELDVQGRMYAQIVSECLKHPLCKSIETWGFTDSHSWLNKDGKQFSPLIFNTTYGKKPAFDAIVDAFLK